MSDETPLVFLYRNYKGEVAIRSVLPKRIYRGTLPPYHEEPQWLMDADDVERGLLRTFALRDVLEWGEGNDNARLRGLLARIRMLCGGTPDAPAVVRKIQALLVEEETRS